MKVAIFLIVSGIATGIITLIRPKFFWDNHKAARRILGDKGTIIVHLIAEVAMIIIGAYLLTRK